MNILLEPKIWEKLTGIEVVDPDGWDRRPKTFDWTKPISLRTFIDKCAESTCRGYVDYPVAVKKASINFALGI